MTQFYVGMAYVLALREKGPNDYQADLHLIDSQHGVKKLCFIATDSNGYGNFNHLLKWIFDIFFPVRTHALHVAYYQLAIYF